MSESQFISAEELLVAKLEKAGKLMIGEFEYTLGPNGKLVRRKLSRNE